MAGEWFEKRSLLLAKFHCSQLRKVLHSGGEVRIIACVGDRFQVDEIHHAGDAADVGGGAMALTESK
jgi:hypothetical protein